MNTTTTLFSSLPGIHASLAGIFFGFFTGYVIYILQKISSIKDEIDRTILSFKPSEIVMVSFGDESKLNSSEDFYNEIKRISYSLSVNNWLSEKDIEDQLKDVFKALSLFGALISNLNNDLGFKPRVENFNQRIFQESYQIFEKNYSLIIDLLRKSLLQVYPVYECSN